MERRDDLPGTMQRSTGNTPGGGSGGRRPGSGEEIFDLLRRGTAELGSEAPPLPETLERLGSLALLLARWSRSHNLTGHREPAAIVRRLILDAAALASALPPFRSLADLGSGAGFPGLPIAILYSQVQVVLVEARERRHHFQRAAVRELGLSNAEPLRGRIEELEPRPSDVAIAQALASPSRALELGLAWVRPGGILALPGAETPPSPPSHPQITSTRVVRYEVPLGGPRRTLWLGQRGGQPATSSGS